MLRSITRGWARAIQSEAFTATQNRFIDFARITVTGGAGGQGCSSFERLRNGKRGRANGGNGGSGGDVIIKSSSSAIGLNISSHHIKGQCGMNGGSDKSHGQNGNDAIITVPVGTVIRFVESSSGRLAHSNSNDWMDMFADPIQHDPSSESEFESENADCSDEDESRETPEAGAVIKDMMRHGDEVVVATGGRGGMGNRASNARYIKGVHQTPSSGTKGTTARIELELKLLADVGLVGYPNAGKSTLLSALCNATPKIDSYPFTTLQPNLGVLEFRDVEKTRVTIADIPGLVDGAAENRGLGHRFLRHIDRTKVLVYVLDIAATETRDPIEDFINLRQELSLYNPDLLHRPSLIFANKIDRRKTTCERNLHRLTEVCEDLPLVAGSAQKRVNLETMVQTLYQLCPKSDPWKLAP